MDKVELRAAAAVLDMWYGTREIWHNPKKPDYLNIEMADPAYLDSCQIIWHEQFPDRATEWPDWRAALARGN